ncbi:programmed cell death protein 2 [Phakopsora pachyrhizi]|nr:programmed cell death protein 2 [Phakopsora pachyrhizi]
MTTSDVDENVCRIKDVMGDTFEDRLIRQALSIHQNNFERALNHLLEGNHYIHQLHPPADQLRQSIADVFSQNSQSSNQSQLVPWGVTRHTHPLPPPSAQGIVQSTESEPAHHPLSTQASSSTSLESHLQVDDARELEVLPSSPPKGLYQPITVTGQTTPVEDYRLTDFSFHQQTGGGTIENKDHRTLSSYQQLPDVKAPSPDLLAMDDSADKRYEAELNAAIQASLATGSPHLSTSHIPTSTEARSLKDLSSEEEQMSKALEESLAMSGSRTVEMSSKYLDPPAHNRQRIPGNPVSLRVQNPHLVFLPCILSAMYAAKPFRDRVLAFRPSSSDPEIVPLIEHDVDGMWNGRSSWRSGENWPEKPRAIEVILAVQRLFAMMTHTKRSYVDVNELSLLLGYEEGETISWTLNEPNKGCNRTYGIIAEAWREFAWETYQATSDPHIDDAEQLEKYEAERRLFFWKGHRLTLPLSQDEEIPSQSQSNTDNSTASLTLCAMGPNLNDVYSCIDAQVWVPESNSAHFLDGTSQVFGFEIDRKSNSSQFNWASSSNLSHSLGESNSPFSLGTEFWIDRYLIQKRHKIVELREEISRIEGEADVSLARRDQLTKAGSKNLVETLRATVEYMATSTQFSSITSSEREKKKSEMLPKFQKALTKLETELLNLDEKAKTASAAAKSVFDIPEMKEFGPHDLRSIVVFDGFSGREHLWSYIKSDDDRWFKSIDQKMIEVSTDSVLSDPAGLHMNSGHIFAIYVRRPSPDDLVIDSIDIPIPSSLQEAIVKDNELFAAEVLESNTLPSNEYPTVDKEVVMSTDSPRSDVAEAGGAVEFGSPLRLSGGAITRDEENGSDFSEDSDDSAGDADDNECSDLVELGFLKKIKRKLDVTKMTGKVGGQPMNAPDDLNPEAYYRSIYVFICRKMSCIRLNGLESIKAFRIQFSEDHYNSAVSNNINRHQLSGDQNKGDLKKGGGDEVLLGPTFKEWELRCDEEPDEAEDPQTLDYLSSFEGFKDGSMKVKNDQDSKVQDTRVPVDEAFLKFQSRVSRAPTQVLRYLRISTPPIEPIFPIDRTKNNILAKGSDCENCGSKRTVEFQIISTILSSLGDLDQSDREGLDFGTILVYTCPKSCAKQSGNPANRSHKSKLTHGNDDGVNGGSSHENIFEVRDWELKESGDKEIEKVGGVEQKNVDEGDEKRTGSNDDDENRKDKIDNNGFRNSFFSGDCGRWIREVCVVQMFSNDGVLFKKSS